MLDMESAYDRAVVGFETVMGEDSTYANGLFWQPAAMKQGQTEAALIRYNEYHLTPRTPWWPTRTGFHHD